VASRDAFAQVEAARDFLVRHRLDHSRAYSDFSWPRPQHFNFAYDWFDVIAEERDREALRIASEQQCRSWSYSELAAESRCVGNFFVERGLRSGQAVLLMVGANVALWVTMLACMRVGAVIIPASRSLDGADFKDRMDRGGVRFVVAESASAHKFEGLGENWVGIAVGEPVKGWSAYRDAASASPILDRHRTGRSHDPMLMYFTSGTTARPKLVVHDHVSYPIGHLSTLYWLGLKVGDVHLNISSPGWAKHAWSSFFAPWLGEATVVAFNHDRFDPIKTLNALVEHKVTTFCAPPTVWRMLVQHDLAQWPHTLREAVSAGEPLNPDVVQYVRSVWELNIRDGFGQTETTALIGNTPGMQLKSGSVGKPLPGFRVRLVPSSKAGEICVELGGERPVGMMLGYCINGKVTKSWSPMHETGDVAQQDEDGYVFFVGRSDDVFKSSDYRISPFELESILVEHAAVAEAAIVPSPDPVRLSVPKAFIGLVEGQLPNAETAESIFCHCRARLPKYKRIMRLEFFELPKTISGKIRRVDLRQLEANRRLRHERGALEWIAEDFPDTLATQPGGISSLREPR
jgi:acetyl-CoA synthetase